MYMKKNFFFLVFTSLFFFAGCSVDEAPAVSKNISQDISKSISNTVSEIQKTEKPENSDSQLKKLVAQEQKSFLEKM